MGVLLEFAAVNILIWFEAYDGVLLQVGKLTLQAQAQDMEPLQQERRSPQQKRASPKRQQVFITSPSLLYTQAITCPSTRLCSSVANHTIF